MKGYFDDRDATAETFDEAGRLRTGDVGVMDARGYLRITDRKKDMFIVGGFNAYPAEIESVLLRHAAVAHVAVVGAPDERLGEVGVAFVVPRARGGLRRAGAHRVEPRAHGQLQGPAARRPRGRAPHERDGQGAQVQAPR